MAGITDRPFRQLCRETGADTAASEMISANPLLLKSDKTRLRLDHSGEVSPRIVQIAGGDPRLLADMARYNVDNGAEVIDINMGCPAKKVCNTLAGSALLRDENLVARLLEAVTGAVNVPVTLKIRTGWDPASKNAVRIARLAEIAGIRRLAVHGRTRACGYGGEAEYDTIAEVKSRVSIPVIANGDIDSPRKAAAVLHRTAADGVMIGRAAQGNPWIFREIRHYIATGEYMEPPSVDEIAGVMQAHLEALYSFYGEYKGVRIARKHIGWYCSRLPAADTLRSGANRAGSCDEQLRIVRNYFSKERTKQHLEMAA